MAANFMIEFLGRLRQKELPREGEEQTDGQLLHCFVRSRDDAALEALVRRHGPMVWSVCSRSLANHHDAEDAFQATFLVLARKAASIRSPELLANWLYGVALQTARKARQTAAKRHARERQVAVLPEPKLVDQDQGFGPDLQGLLDEELGCLPDKYRIAIILCDLQQKSRPEVARQLSLPEGTVASRLARARALLAQRLVRRGLPVSAGTLAAVLPQQAAAAVPPAVLSTTLEAASLLAGGEGGKRNLIVPSLLVLLLLGLGAALILSLDNKRVPLAARASAAPPPAVDVVASFPGASAEEVERQVTIPLEVTLAGMTGLEHLSTQSVFGQCVVRAQFKKSTDLARARQQVISRLQTLQKLPVGVTPSLAAVPAGALVRYTLRNPRDDAGRPLYTLGDLTTLQDWVVDREFRRIPRVIDAVRLGGAERRYEVHPDPDRLKAYGITLQQLETAIVEGAANVGGALKGPGAGLRVRGVGLLGGGRNPLDEALRKKDPRAAAAHLRAEEVRRLWEIRQLVITRVKNVPILVEDVVEGGRLRRDDPSHRGVVVAHQPSHGRVGLSRARKDKDRVSWEEEDDLVQGALLLRQGEDARTALAAVKAKIKELNNTAGRLLPGVRIEVYDEGTDLGLAGSLNHTWLQANLPANVGLDEATRTAGKVRELLRRHTEAQTVVSLVGGTEDGADPGGFNRVRFFVVFKPRKDWPGELRQELEHKFPGVDWSFSATCRDSLAETFTAAPGEGLLKIYGPDLGELQRLAGKAKQVLSGLAGVDGVRIVSLAGPGQLEFRVDPDKCKKWGISPAEVKQLLARALDDRVISQMVEGERLTPIVLRWSARPRGAGGILDIPVEVGGGVEGKPTDTTNPPRLRLRDLVTPLDREGKPDPKGDFLRAGVAVIYREDGKRMIAVRYGVRDREEATIRAEAKKKTEHLFNALYRAQWDER
jgi:RNA polymerase sigma factor (sigma-70 family)